MRVASRTISSAVSRALSSVARCASSSAAPRIPPSGFLISWARPAAIWPIACEALALGLELEQPLLERCGRAARARRRSAAPRSSKSGEAATSTSASAVVAALDAEVALLRREARDEHGAREARHRVIRAEQALDRRAAAPTRGAARGSGSRARSSPPRAPRRVEDDDARLERVEHVPESRATGRELRGARGPPPGESGKAVPRCPFFGSLATSYASRALRVLDFRSSARASTSSSSCCAAPRRTLRSRASCAAIVEMRSALGPDVARLAAQRARAAGAGGARRDRAAPCGGAERDLAQLQELRARVLDAARRRARATSRTGSPSTRCAPPTTSCLRAAARRARRRDRRRRRLRRARRARSERGDARGGRGRRARASSRRGEARLADVLTRIGARAPGAAQEEIR